MKETLIFGHKSPDTDSITSSIVMTNLEKHLGGENPKACRLGKLNKEIEEYKKTIDTYNDKSNWLVIALVSIIVIMGGIICYMSNNKKDK